MQCATSRPKLLRSMVCLSSGKVSIFAEECDCHRFNNLCQSACFANTATSKPQRLMISCSCCDGQKQRGFVGPGVKASLQRQGEQGDSINSFACCVNFFQQVPGQGCGALLSWRQGEDFAVLVARLKNPYGNCLLRFRYRLP